MCIGVTARSKNMQTEGAVVYRKEVEQQQQISSFQFHRFRRTVGNSRSQQPRQQCLLIDAIDLPSVLGLKIYTALSTEHDTEMTSFLTALHITRVARRASISAHSPSADHAAVLPCGNNSLAMPKLLKENGATLTAFHACL